MNDVFDDDVDGILREAVGRAQPGQWRDVKRALFEYGRILWCYEGYERGTAVEVLDWALVPWHEVYGKGLGLSFTEVRIMFHSQYPNIKFSADAHPAVDAFKLVRSRPRSEIAQRYADFPALAILVDVCRELQRVNYPHAFALSFRDIARELGLGEDKRTLHKVGDYLDLLKVDGLIRLYRSGMKRGRKASEYWFLPDVPAELAVTYEEEPQTTQITQTTPDYPGLPQTTPDYRGLPQTTQITQITQSPNAQTTQITQEPALADGAEMAF